MKIKEFLTTVVKEQNSQIGLDYNLPYHAFVIDSIAIELIGKLSFCKNVKELGN